MSVVKGFVALLAVAVGLTVADPRSGHHHVPQASELAAAHLRAELLAEQGIVRWRLAMIRQGWFTYTVHHHGWTEWRTVRIGSR